MLLAGKTAIITGAASKRGIGRASARLFAEHGARVAIVDVDGDAAGEAAGHLPGENHLGIACDVTQAGQCTQAVAQTIEAFGGLDIVANIAGITQPLGIAEITEADWDRVLDVNLRGTLLMSQACIEPLRARGGGAILCMSSVSAQRGGGIFGGPHYSAAKAGVLGLAKAMARELGPDNIRVNCVTPSLIETDITAGKLDDARRAEILRDIPLGRLGQADDVAGVLLFLASPLSSYLTGTVIDINGGMLIHG